MAYHYNRRNKYGNKKCEIDGHKFDSQHEAFRYTELKILERAGEITELELQVPFTLQESFLNAQTKRWAKPITYVADFTYRDKDGKLHIEDAKGYLTDVYKMKKKMMAYRGLFIEEV